MTDPVKSLFLEARELEGEAREGFLAERCGSDAALRKRVDALLSAGAAAPDFLGEPLVSAAPGETEGTVIGRYKLLQQIGEGGFGTVWMAEQQEPVRRMVALKIIKLGMDTRQVVARFEAERQALALMDHPNIARVLDGGATESGRPYFVMELVRGVPITEYCDQAKLPTRERLELFVRVCHAVQHAHQKGIIHRDIKPSNVMVTLHDGSPVPMVIDFGIAKATSQRLTEKTLFTGFRQFVGTPQYMAPEQAEISGLDVDTRADIYSLGVLLYELLTGTTPFDATTLREAAYEEILRVIREVDPPRPSTRVSTLGERSLDVALRRDSDPGALSRLMRGDLDWIVMRAISKERSRRYDTSNDLAADVGRFLTYEPVAARPPSRAYRLHKFAQRNRVGVLASLLVALAVLGGSGVATVGFLRASDQRDRARESESLAMQETQRARDAELREREQRERASSNEGRALAEAQSARDINAFFNELLASIDPQQLSSFSAYAPEGRAGLATAAGFDREVSVAEMLRGAGRRVDQSFEGKPELEAEVRETLGVTLLGLGLSDDAIPQLEAARDLRTELDGPQSASALRSQVLLASALSANGRNERAEGILRATVEGMREVHGPEAARTLSASSLLGRVLSQRGSYDEAERILHDTLEAQQRALGPTSRDTLDTLGNVVGNHLWQSEGAHELALEAHELTRRHLSPNDIVSVLAETHLGASYGFLHDFAASERHLRAALGDLQRIVGERHPDTLNTKMHLALALQGESQAEERETLLRAAVAGLSELEEISPVLFVARRDLTFHLTNKGAIEEAAEVARENFRASRRYEGAEHPRTREAETTLAHCLYQLSRSAETSGRTDLAERALRERVELRRQVFSEDSVQTCNALASLTTFLLECDQVDEARHAWQRIIDLRRRMCEAPDAGAGDHLIYAQVVLDARVPDLRDPLAALEPLHRADELSGGENFEILEDLSRAAWLAGRASETRDATQRLLELGGRRCAPDFAQADVLMAHARRLLYCNPADLRDAEAALTFATRAVEASGDAPAALELLSTACRSVGRDVEADDLSAFRLERLREAIAGPDADPHAVHSLAWALVSVEPPSLRAPVEALQLAQRALEADGHEHSEFYNTLGVALFRAGRFEEALEPLATSERLNRGMGLDDNPAWDLVFRAMCLHGLERNDEARAVLAESQLLLEGDRELVGPDREELDRYHAEARTLLGALAGS